MHFFGLVALEPFSKHGALNAVIETPKGSRNKFKYRLDRGLFKLSGVLPVGASFPFDFGFIPGTLAPDGDPMDVLILMDEPAFPGCLVGARLVGAIEADQTEDGKKTRNDRLIAVAEESLLHKSIREMDDLNDDLLDQIEHFFVSYNSAKGKKFKVLARRGPKRAQELVEESAKRYRAESAESADRARSLSGDSPGKSATA